MPRPLTDTEEAAFILTYDTSDLPRGQSRVYNMNGQPVLVFHADDGTFYDTYVGDLPIETILQIKLPQDASAWYAELPSELAQRTTEVLQDAVDIATDAGATTLQVAQKVAEAVPNALNTTINSLPIIAVALALVGGVLLFSYAKGH